MIKVCELTTDDSFVVFFFLLLFPFIKVRLFVMKENPKFCELFADQDLTPESMCPLYIFRKQWTLHSFPWWCRDLLLLHLPSDQGWNSCWVSNQSEKW